MYGRADLCIKLAQQVILTDEELLRELVKGQRLAVMLVDVVQHRIHHLIARADRPGIAAVGGGAVQPDQQLLVGLNRAAADRGDARPVGTSDQVVDAVLHYINEHYSEPLTLDQLSEKFFISKYHLLRKFDAQVGTTVHRYILQKRLLNAKQLLARGVPPNEVCQYCGFGDYANFYRAFRAEYNQTPRQYIQSARGK